MKDNTEGGSGTPGSASQHSAKPAATTSQATPDRSPTRDPVQSHADSQDDAEVRPVSADMQQFIGRQLRAVFDDVAKQPIPDRFLELMKQLDNKTGAR